ncbi:DUF1413 domain-containing protein [Pectobacterium brasiliense]|nr:MULTISPECIES: DUF1413 domain-containing protein [Pectobacterium]MBN3097748.1 DUF1413 domain-containing protein [Pectobacterium brasiliense]MBN3167624.1 DUF1413 domain-containing protein [Pectobacterium brasiliense]
MNISLEIDDNIAKSLLDESCKSSQSFNEYVSSVLENHVSSVTSDENILSVAIQRAAQLPIGSKFILKELIGDMWESVESPKSFGRTFKKRSSHIVKHVGVTSSNKALYERYEFEGHGYLMYQCTTQIGNTNLP